MFLFSKGYMYLRRLMAARDKRSLSQKDTVQVIRTLNKLDEILVRIDAARRRSDAEYRNMFPTFRMEFNTQVPDDPYSEEYAKVQFELYERIAGKPYSVENEKNELNLDSAAVRPFPYYTENCETVGNHLAAVAHAIRSMKLAPGAKVVEFGPGWGNTTLALARMGFDITAVDIEKNFCDLISRRAKQAGVKINTINADFSWVEQIVDPVDAILFFECFHHASDHLRIIRALDKAVKDDGKVYFAAEPITVDFPIPWGLRLDGESLWAIRKFGWLELGFAEQYFIRTLRKFGWVVERHTTTSTPWGTVYEATKWKKYSRNFLASDPMIRTQIGVKSDDGLVTSNGPAGYLIYGPYISLPTGKYVAKLLFSDKTSLAGKGRAEIACRNGKVILSAKEIDFKTLRRNGEIQIEFENPQHEFDIEIRLDCYEKVVAKLYAIDIKEIVEI